MYRLFDYGPLDLALEELRTHDPIAYRALHAVYVYGWLRDVSGVTEAAVARGLAFLSPRLAAFEFARGRKLRAPGMEPPTRIGRGPMRAEAGSALKAQRDRAMREAAAAGATVDELCERFGVSKSTVYAVVNARDDAAA